MHPIPRKALESLEKIWPELEQLLSGKEANRTRLIGIGGPGGAGKSSVAHWLVEKIPQTAILPLDDYRLPRHVRAPHGILGSHPQGNDLERLNRDLDKARNGQAFDRPVFDSIAGEATATETVPPVRNLLCEGEIAAHLPLRNSFGLFILVESHWRVQLNTRLSRDIDNRSYSIKKALEVFLKSNLSDYPEHSRGAEAEADMILYRTSHGTFRQRKR
ncbi:MAG: hypothetical protein AAGJ81_16200 [Verrucomicrobiota bacterium]